MRFLGAPLIFLNSDGVNQRLINLLKDGIIGLIIETWPSGNSAMPNGAHAR